MGAFSSDLSLAGKTVLEPLDKELQRGRSQKKPGLQRFEGPGECVDESVLAVSEPLEVLEGADWLDVASCPDPERTGRPSAFFKGPTAFFLCRAHVMGLRIGGGLWFLWYPRELLH